MSNVRTALTSNVVNARVVVVDEESANAGTRREAYANATAEKMTRAGVRSACERALRRHGPCVIVDSMNAIKGYRYELWCVARAIGARYAVVYVEASDDDAAARNRSRDASVAYDDAILRDLCLRFEHPVGTNRWDAPLFTFRPATDSANHEADVLDAICAHVRGDRSAFVASARALIPNKATQNVPLSDTNLRYEMDRATQEVVDAVCVAVKENGGAPCSSYAFGEGMPIFKCSRALTLAELRRRKRDFLQLASKSLSRPTRDDVKRLFIECLQQQCDA